MRGFLANARLYRLLVLISIVTVSLVACGFFGNSGGGSPGQSESSGSAGSPTAPVVAPPTVEQPPAATPPPTVAQPPAATPPPTVAQPPTVAPPPPPQIPTAVPTPIPPPIRDAPRREINLDECPTEVTIGDEYDCTIVVKNLSSSWYAEDVVLTITLPDLVTFLKAITNNPEVKLANADADLTWDVGGLAPGAAFEVKLTLKTETTQATLGTHLNLRWVDDTVGEHETLGAGSGFTQHLEGSEEPATVTKPFSYTLTLTQQGRRGVGGINVLIKLPGNLTINPDEPTDADFSSEREIRFTNVGLLVNEVKEFRFGVIPTESGPAVVTAEISRQQFNDGEPIIVQEGTRVLD